MTLEAIAIVALATWRLSYMLVSERGPFRLFERIRARVGVRVVEMEHQQSWGMEKVTHVTASNELGELFTCVYCLSVWVAPALFALWSGSAFGQVIVVWLAISGAALVLGSVANIGR